MAFALSEEHERELAEIISRYPNKMAACIPTLHLCQESNAGYISEEVIGFVSKRLELSPAHVKGVVTFYSLLNETPPGKHQVWVCRTLSCALRGSGALLSHCEKRLGVHAVVNSPDALRVDGEMSEHVLAHLRRDGDDPIGGLQGRALRPARHRVPRAELLLLPGPEGLEAVERDHERDLEERAHEQSGQRHVPGMRVHDVGVHAVAGHEQVGREGFERRRVAGVARCGWAVPGQPVPGRIAAHAQPVFGPLVAAKAAHLDRGPAGERAAQVLDDDARAAVDVRRILAGEHQHSYGDVPITRRRHQGPSRHARG